MKNPLHLSWQTEIWPTLITLLAIALSLWSYPHLPAQVVTHWGFYGEPNGWSSRTFHAILFPGILVFMYALLSIVPLFDKVGQRYEEFAGVYRTMRNLIMLVFLVIFMAATASNLGYVVNMGAAVAGVIGMMMAVLGNYFGKLKRNSFIGIRTPWTLKSDNVWNKTHRLGGRVFIVWGLGLMITPWLAPKIALVIVMGGIIAIIIGLTAYSYFLFAREKKGL